MKTTRLLLIICVCFVQFGFLNAQTTIVLRPDASYGKDAYIDSRVYYNNYGNHPDFTSIAWTNGGTPTTVRGLLDFDISSIPNGAIINSAYLSLYSYNSPANGSHSSLSGSNTSVLQRITSTWDESTVTWQSQPSSTSANEVILAESGSSIQDYLNIDVSALMQDMVNNKSNSFGFMLKLATEERYRRMVFASSDNGDPSLHPQLEITYTLPTSACITLRPNAGAGKDAYIDRRVSGNNYGNHPDFPAIAWTNGGTPTVVRGLLDFDLSSIPSGATINSAQLSLYSYNSPANGAHSKLSGSNTSVLQRIVSPWNESTVTWNNQPSATTLHQVALPASTSSIQHYLNINVNALVQDMVNNKSNSFGFLIKLATEQHYRRMIFASSDNANAALHPQLTVCYTTSYAQNRIITPSIESAQDKNLAKSGISVYPNPTRNGIINVTNSIADGKSAQIHIYTMRGKLVKSVTAKTRMTSIDLRNSVPQGLYFIKVYSGNGKVFSQKLVVE